MNKEITYWLPNENAMVVWEGEEYSYQYICNRVLSIAKAIKDTAGFGNNVGIYMKRCPDVMFAMLASLVSGNVYVPIDTIMPQERVKYILEDANVEYILTNSEDKDNFQGRKVILLDEILNDLPMEHIDFAENEDAYIIYTSGSTGMPKGVSISKDNIVNFIEGVCEKITFKKGAKIACLTSYSFDIFFLESLMALHKGLKVYFANEHQKNNPIAGFKFLIENDIEMLQLTPSRIQQYINYDNKLDFLKKVKILMIGGEEMPEILLRKLQGGFEYKVYNMYGPTETTIWAAIGDVTNSKKVHAGEALKNTGLYIVDEDLNICEYGVKGELCISGKLLSKGYYNNEEITKKKFITLNNERVYRTGDIASISEDNKLYIYGRVDNQVKIRGYRIELEEIENVIRNAVLLDNVVVLAVNINESSEKNLIAFYSTQNEQIDVAKLKESLQKFLPQYMIPEQFYKIDEFPLTVSGKVDRNKIVINYLSNHNQKTDYSNDDLKVDEVEQKIINIIKKCLGSQDIVVEKNSDLASIGVDSISFVKIIVGIECEFDMEFDMEELFDYQKQFRTVGEWIDFVKKAMDK